MSAAIASGPAPRVDQPKHPLPGMTTYELRAYRRQIENAIAFFDAQHSVPAVRDDLQARLDDAIAEQESRQRIADA
jgi:hypothetical protein